MVIVKGNDETEAGVLPSEEILAAMGAYNEELVKAGVLLAAVSRSRFARCSRRTTSVRI
jgi:hypothetical protein